MSHVPVFADRQVGWSHPPVDDIGYISSKELLQYDDEALRQMIAQVEKTRYEGWRNYKGAWRRILGLDHTRGARVLDYGCGIGVEALQYARNENEILLADIVQSNLRLARRVLDLHGFEVAGEILLGEEPELSGDADSLDVVHCAGVLHHIPDPVPVVEQMARWLRPGGQLRLMVYSDIAWKIATDSEPPYVVNDHPLALRYAERWDSVGGYADWYDRERLEERFGDWFEVVTCEPVTQHGEYLGAVLVKR